MYLYVFIYSVEGVGPRNVRPILTSYLPVTCVLAYLCAPGSCRQGPSSACSRTTMQTSTTLSSFLVLLYFCYCTIKFLSPVNIVVMLSLVAFMRSGGVALDGPIAGRVGRSPKPLEGKPATISRKSVTAKATLPVWRYVGKDTRGRFFFLMDVNGGEGFTTLNKQLFRGNGYHLNHESTAYLLIFNMFYTKQYFWINYFRVYHEKNTVL